MSRAQRSIADGDVCPVDESHGPMYVTRGNKREYCPHVSHDGKSRAFWPYAPALAFQAAVKEYRNRYARTGGQSEEVAP